MKIRDIFLFLKILGNTLCNPLFIKEKKMSRSSNGYPGSKGIETRRKSNLLIEVFVRMVTLVLKGLKHGRSFEIAT